MKRQPKAFPQRADGAAHVSANQHFPDPLADTPFADFASEQAQLQTTMPSELDKSASLDFMAAARAGSSRSSQQAAEPLTRSSGSAVADFEAQYGVAVSSAAHYVISAQRRAWQRHSAAHACARQQVLAAAGRADAAPHMRARSAPLLALPPDLVDAAAPLPPLTPSLGVLQTFASAGNAAPPVLPEVDVPPLVQRGLGSAAQRCRAGESAQRVAPDDRWLLVPQPPHILQRDLQKSGIWPAPRLIPVLEHLTDRWYNSRRNIVPLVEHVLSVHSQAFLDRSLLDSRALVWFLQRWASDRQTAQATERVLEECGHEIVALIGTYGGKRASQAAQYSYWAAGAIQ